VTDDQDAGGSGALEDPLSRCLSPPRIRHPVTTGGFVSKLGQRRLNGNASARNRVSRWTEQHSRRKASRSCRGPVGHMVRPVGQMVRRRTRTAIAADQRPWVQPFNQFNHKSRQMPVRSPLIHRRWQQNSCCRSPSRKLIIPPPPLVCKPAHPTTLCAAPP
jgi:hypothetical protein